MHILAGIIHILFPNNVGKKRFAVSRRFITNYKKFMAIS